MTDEQFFAAFKSYLKANYPANKLGNAIQVRYLTKDDKLRALTVTNHESIEDYCNRFDKGRFGTE